MTWQEWLLLIIGTRVAMEALVRLVDCFDFESR